MRVGKRARASSRTVRRLPRGRSRRRRRPLGPFFPVAATGHKKALVHWRTRARSRIVVPPPFAPPAVPTGERGKRKAEPQPVRHHRVMGDKPSRGNGRVPKAATARGGFAAWLWGVIRAGAAAMLAANASLSGRCRPAEHLPVTAGRRSTGEIIAHGSRPQPWNSCVTQRPPKKAAWRAGRLACTSAKTAMRRGMGSHPAMPRRAPEQGDRTRSLL